MNAQEFRDALEQLDLTQVEFAKLIGINPRTVRGYALGEAPVPSTVRLILWFLERHPKELKNLPLTDSAS